MNMRRLRQRKPKKALDNSAKRVPAFIFITDLNVLKDIRFKFCDNRGLERKSLTDLEDACCGDDACSGSWRSNLAPKSSPTVKVPIS